MTRDDIGLQIIDDRHPVFRRTCHGDPRRSFWFRGHPLPLCSRCMSFYPSIPLGLILGTLMMTIFQPSSLFMLILVMSLFFPLVIDGVTQYYGYRRSNDTLRVITGILAGTGGGVAIIYMSYRLV